MLQPTAADDFRRNRRMDITKKFRGVATEQSRISWLVSETERLLHPFAMPRRKLRLRDADLTRIKGTPVRVTPYGVKLRSIYASTLSTDRRLPRAGRIGSFEGRRLWL